MNELPSSTALAEKPDVREEVDDVGDRLGGEHDRVRAGVERRRARPSAARGRRPRRRAPRRRARRRRVPSEVRPAAPPSRAHREHASRCTSVSGIADVDAERVRRPRPCVAAAATLPAAVRPRDARLRRRSRAAASARGARRRRRASRRQARSGVSTGAGRGQAGEVRVLGRVLRARPTASAQHSRERRRRPCGSWPRRPTRLPSTARTRDLQVLLGDVLVDAVVGEAGERSWRSRRRAPRPASACVSVEAALRRARSASCAGQRVHRPTPTWTSRKRAGAAPCATCATCIGSPLPQLGRPQTCQSSRAADRVAAAPELRRDAGVVRVLAPSAPSLPSLISQPISRAELEVEPLVVDRPASCSSRCRGRRRCRRSGRRESHVAGLERDGRHADERDAVPAVGAHAAVARAADRRRAVSREVRKPVSRPSRRRCSRAAPARPRRPSRSCRASRGPSRRR